MFDLFRSRAKIVKFFLGAILVVVSLSMLTYLIPSYDTGAPNAPTAVLAEVGKDTITLQDMQQLIQNNLRSRQLPNEILPSLIPQMVQDQITQYAEAYEAQRLGFQVTDADVSNTIRQTIPALFPQGTFVGKDAYAAMLAQQNLTIPQFESDLRRQILIARLRSVAMEGTVISPAEVEQAFRKKNEKIRIQWVKLTSDKYKSEIQPTASELQSYYNANKVSYRTPEKKNLAILIGDENKLEQSLTPSDAELRREYDQNQDSYRVPESIDLRQILFKTTGQPAEDAKVQAKAEDVLKQLKAGANFADMAKKYSEDPGSAQNGGEYKGVTRGQMVQEFEQAAFALKPGQLSGLVKSSIGYHIILVEKHQEARLKPFEEIKDQLATQWKKQRASEQIQNMADKAESELQKEPLHPEKVAADLNMQLVQANGVEAGKPIPEVGVNNDFNQSIASLKKGEVSQPVSLPNNRIALAVVSDVIPPRAATFEEVQSQIRDVVVGNKTREVLQKHAQELVNKAKADGGDIGKAAKSMGLDAKTSDPIELTSNIEGLGQASFLANVFGQPAGTVFGPFPQADSSVVGKIVERVPVDMSQLPAQRDSILNDLRTQRQRDRTTLFDAGLLDRLTKEGKLKVHKPVIDQLVASFLNNQG